MLNSGLTSVFICDFLDEYLNASKSASLAYRCQASSSVLWRVSPTHVGLRSPHQADGHYHTWQVWPSAAIHADDDIERGCPPSLESSTGWSCCMTNQACCVAIALYPWELLYTNWRSSEKPQMSLAAAARWSLIATLCWPWRAGTC